MTPSHIPSAPLLRARNGGGVSSQGPAATYSPMTGNAAHRASGVLRGPSDEPTVHTTHVFFQRGPVLPGCSGGLALSDIPQFGAVAGSLCSLADVLIRTVVGLALVYPRTPGAEGRYPINAGGIQ